MLGGSSRELAVGSGGPALVWLCPGEEGWARRPSRWGGGRAIVHLLLGPRDGMRYVAKVLKTALAEKFPDATENEIHKASVIAHPHLESSALP